MLKKYFSELLIVLLGVLLFSTNAFAENETDPQVGTSAKGTYLKAVLLDSLTRNPIEFATMSAKYIGEQTAKRYALSDDKGVVIVENMKVGRASVAIEYMGYKARHITFDIKKGANDMGEVLLQEDINVLDAAVVSGVANPIVIKKDTIEYNASSFKINETDMLEELIKKLPGIEVGTDGSITANGKTINKIMIEGKTFFLDDPTLATKNLPAKIVEKVRIVERKSDQARFTGIDDGDEETVLDLGIKAGMMKGWFGNLAGGLGYDKGTDDLRFEAGAMVGRFKDKTQISLIGNGNNTNNRGFTDMAGNMMGGMRGGRGMGGNKGVTTSWMGGVNVNASVLDNKMDLSGNALYNGSEQVVTEEKTKTTMLADGRSMFNKESSSDVTTTEGFRFGGEMDYDISDNTSILFRPNINIGKGSFMSTNDFSTLTDGNMTNEGYSKNFGNNDSQRFGGTLLFRQRLGKPGRTMSIRLNYDYSNNDLVGFNQSETTYYTDNVAGDPTIVDQKYIQNEKSNSMGGRISYTEPLGRNYFVEAAYRYNYKKTNSDKETFSKDSLDEYSIIDNEYTTHYENVYITQQYELSFMKQEEKYNFTFGVNMQPSTTQTKGYTPTSTLRDTSYSVINFSPSARFDYRFSRDKMLRLNYRGRTSQPSISQMMPIPDNTNPLIIKEGNPNLNPEFSHNMGVEYRANNKTNFSWFSSSLDASYTTDKIVAKKYYTDEGVQVTNYENTNKGVYSVSGRLMFNSKIAKSNFSISSFSNVRYGNSISYVQDGSGNSQGGMQNKAQFVENVTRTFSISENLRITYRNDWAELIVGGRVTYQDAWYTVSSMDKVATWTNGVNGSANNTIPRGLNFTSDINYTFYIGYEGDAAKPYTMWNASLSKTLFKNSATLKVKMYDILKQSKNLTRTTTENYVQDVLNNTLGQYFMVTFTWRFGNFGDMKKMRGPGGMGRGGMGGGHMGGGFGGPMGGYRR